MGLSSANLSLAKVHASLATLDRLGRPGVDTEVLCICPSHFQACAIVNLNEQHYGTPCRLYRNLAKLHCAVLLRWYKGARS